MKTTTVLLTGLFLGQVAVAGALYFNTVSQRSVRPEGNLLALAETEVDSISIEGDENTITLEKNDDLWTVAANGLPVDPEKLNNALDTLKELQLGWAVATTDASHRQLEVADDNYQRRVVFRQGDDQLGDLYLGTSPGFRRTHARRGGEDEVYSVAVNTYDLPDNTEGWLDRALLQVGGVTSVQINGKPLSKEGDNWAFDGSDQTDQVKASELVSSFENMRVLSLFEEDDDSVEFSTVTVAADNNEFDYRFGELDGDYLVSRRDIDATFTISKSSYDKVINAELVLPGSTETENSASESGSNEASGEELTTETPAGAQPDTQSSSDGAINQQAPTEVESVVLPAVEKEHAGNKPADPAVHNEAPAAVGNTE